MSALAAEMPVKPNNAATSDTTKKTKAHFKSDIAFTSMAQPKPTNTEGLEPLCTTAERFRGSALRRLHHWVDGAPAHIQSSRKIPSSVSRLTRKGRRFRTLNLPTRILHMVALLQRENIACKILVPRRDAARRT